MREKYNSPDYWKNLDKGKTPIKGHIFMEKPPTKNCLYFHTLAFSKANGMNNIWGYFPNLKSFIGYLQYSFLPEAFYKWINGRNKLITKIPSISVEQIIRDGIRMKLITKETGEEMRKDVTQLSELWEMPLSAAEKQLKRFLSNFNKKWMGDNQEFIFIKFFKSPEEVGDFVEESSLLTSSETELENKIGMKLSEWKDICKNSLKDKLKGERFREILLKKLTEVL